MRFSRLGLGLKYANRSVEFQRVVLLFLVGTICGFPLLLFVALDDLRLSLSGVQRAGEPIWLAPFVVPLAGALMTLGIGIYLIVVGIRTIRRRVGLIAAGSTALGVVEEVGVVVPRRGRRYMESLRYRFLIEKDGRQQIRTEKVKLDLAIKLSEIKVGDLILVVYDPADPARHEIDYFQARQEDRSRLVAKILEDGTNSP